MKFKKNILLFVICFFIFFVKVDAASFNVKCDSPVDVNGKSSCLITIPEATKDVNGFKATLSITDGNAKYASFSSRSGFTYDSSKNQISGNFTTVTSRSIEVGTLSLVIQNNTEFLLIGGTCVDDKCKTERVPVKINTIKQTTTTKQKSSNNYLSSITVDGNLIEDFSKTKTKYYLEVDHDTEIIELKAEAEDELAKVNIEGPDKLEIGDNEFTIGVTSEDESTKFYKVIVTRKEKDKSSDTTLKDITIKDYKFNFDRNSKTFYLTIAEKTEKLNIKVVTSDENAEYEIFGNENLTAGSQIKIKVTAENGDEETYRIIIKKEKEDNFLPVIIVCITLAIIILVILVTLIIKKKSKKEKDKTKDKDSTKKEETDAKKKEENNEELEKTKKIQTIDDTTSHVDNDEVEETRTITYEEEKELEKTKVLDLDDELNKKIEEELEKTLTSEDFK